MDVVPEIVTNAPRPGRLKLDLQHDVDSQKKYVIEHQNDPFGRGPHFHGAEQKYPGQDLLKADERYRRIPGTQGHYPEDFGGFRNNGK
ncbi:HNH/endonuclease VII fold putative polymorphic toxin [Paenibacillus sp. P46E]|uniref:HNH/endonuclease VII fold putative polymorphic toxin n=1 Tax=Paenibacillus sp. P46E TaxID=1349436 RepID=UPI00355905A9